MADGRKQDLRDSDVRALIRLSGELSEIGKNLALKREHCLIELVRISNADKAVFAEFSRQQVKETWSARLGSVQFAHTPQDEQRRLLGFYDRDEPVDPIIKHMGGVAAEVMVGRPGDFMADVVWRASPHYNIVRRPAGVVEQIYAHFRIGSIACGIGLHRREARPFHQREVRVIDAFMRGAGRALHAPATGPGVAEVAAQIDPATLPPRLAAVLNRFLLGETEKKAAKFLGVTRHTVHSYAKQLYQRLGVTSRSELLARFIRRH